jgi:hypothetical protein
MGHTTARRDRAHPAELIGIELQDTEGRLKTALAARARALLNTEAIDQPYREALTATL